LIQVSGFDTSEHRAVGDAASSPEAGPVAASIKAMRGSGSLPNVLIDAATARAIQNLISA
jgi:hypothetical protein